MSIKILLQNKPGLPPWALADLLLIVRQFHCRATLHNGEILIDGKKWLEVASIAKPDLTRVEVGLNGEDEDEALDTIRQSKIGRFIAQSK